jgi:hypothetical protein
LSIALVRLNKLKPWKMKPKRRLRSAASTSGGRAPTLTPSMRYSPPLGLSRQPRMFIAVDLPQPEVPRIATNSPGSMLRSTPRSACTAASPSP